MKAEEQKDIQEKESEINPSEETNDRFKIGDKVRITLSDKSKKTRAEGHFMFEGKIGTIKHIWDLKENHWGNYVVTTPDGFQDCFYEEELNIVDNDKE